MVLNNENDNERFKVCVQYPKLGIDTFKIRM